MNIFNALKNYNVVFDSQSKNAGESMPLGGRDIGCNVWVEKNLLYIYMAQSGSFDENGNMVKAGRLKLDINPFPFSNDFKQELRLETGDIKISGNTEGIKSELLLWVDVARGVLNLQFESKKNHRIVLSYENWRTEENKYPFPDTVLEDKQGLIFYHQNKESSHFKFHLHQEELEQYEKDFPDVQKNLIFGGAILSNQLEFSGVEKSSYAGLPCDAYKMEGKTEVFNVQVAFTSMYTPEINEWLRAVNKQLAEASLAKSNKAENDLWWKNFWQRSYVFIKNGDEPAVQKASVEWQSGRNYQLFRYMQACNAYGLFPTKFNGGLFTIDPAIWGSRYGAKTPDERDWGGIIFTAQNQRHVYWPMLKNGDADMMRSQFDFYLRLLNGAVQRTSHFFNTKNAACIPEQTDANGFSAFYGFYGLDYPIQVRYHYVTSVEFSYMMLKYIDYTGEKNVEPYINFIAAIIAFYDQKYSRLDQNNKRVIFPSTAQETYHKAGIIDSWGEQGRRDANYNEDEVAVTNPADVIYALNAVLDELLQKGYGSESQRDGWKKLKSELPPVPLEVKKEHTVIAPCEFPKNYVRTNCEFPQLYCCYPYHEIGIGESNNKDLQLARDTFFYGWDGKDQLMNISWMHIGIFAARLGLTQKAAEYQFDKLKDSGRRFPAFWGPGHDYTPDHNWGGSGMSGLQEMLLQNFGGKIYLLPAWPKNLDVSFKLWVEHNTYVEVEYKDGKLKYTISDSSREKDVIVAQ